MDLGTILPHALIESTDLEIALLLSCYHLQDISSHHFQFCNDVLVTLVVFAGHLQPYACPDASPKEPAFRDSVTVLHELSLKCLDCVVWLVFKQKLGFVYIKCSQSGYRLNSALPYKYPSLFQAVVWTREDLTPAWALPRRKMVC